MFKNISEKYQFYLLLGAFFLVLWLSYLIALQGTFHLRTEYKELKLKFTQTDELPEQIAHLRKQLLTINKRYFENFEQSGDNHELILQTISRLADQYGVAVEDYPPRHVINNSGVSVETHQITLEGRYKNLLRTIQSIETESHVGRLVSIRFYSETERKTKRKYLYAQIYIQNYSNTKGNEKVN